MDSTSGSSVIVTEWNLNFDSGLNHIVHALSQIEKQIEQLDRSQDAPNIVFPLSFMFNIEKERTLVHLLNPIIYGFRLSELPTILRNERLSKSSVEKIAGDILEGLLYLHSHSMCHGDLRDVNVYMDSRSGVCKLFGFEVCGKMVNLLKDSSSRDSETKDKDIQRFGLLLFWLSSDWKYSFLNIYATSVSDLINIYLPKLFLPLQLSDFMVQCLFVKVFSEITQILSHDYLSKVHLNHVNLSIVHLMLVSFFTKQFPKNGF